MKVSYRTHPILKIIEDETSKKDTLKNLKGLIDENTFNAIDLTFNLFKEAKENIEILSNNLEKAISLSFWKLQKEEYYKELYGKSGVLINGTTTFIYKIIDANNLYVIHFVGTELFCKMYCTKGKTEYFITPGFKSDISHDQIARFTVNEIATKLIFLKYCDIETKYLAEGQKIKGVYCNYKNDTKCNVKYLNITWFSNLIKSDGFNVRGHFRLQPKKKDGEWTKELIWITDFQKLGYTAPARKLSHMAGIPSY